MTNRALNARELLTMYILPRINIYPEGVRRRRPPAASSATDLSGSILISLWGFEIDCVN